MIVWWLCTWNVLCCVALFCHIAEFNVFLAENFLYSVFNRREVNLQWLTHETRLNPTIWSPFESTHQHFAFTMICRFEYTEEMTYFIGWKRIQTQHTPCPIQRTQDKFSCSLFFFSFFSYCFCIHTVIIIFLFIFVYIISSLICNCGEV